MSDIEKLAVFDDRIIQSRPKYAVEKGALSLTNVPFRAITATGSQHTYQITVPSQNVFVDRALDWTARCYLQFTATYPLAPAPAPLVNTPVAVVGRDFALCALPLNSLVQTAQATINDTTATMNSGDVLREVLRLADSKKNRAQRTCPTMLDTYQNYNDAFGAIRNPLAGYSSSSSNDEVPNGAWYDLQFTNPTGGVLVGNGSYVVGAQTVNYVDGVPVCDGVSYSFPLFITFRTTEKLVISPLIFSEACENDTGLFGIENISVVLTMASPSLTNQAGRVLRVCNNSGATISNVAYNQTTQAGSPFTDATINVQFLTPSLDIPLPPKSIVPWMEYPRYISNFSNTIQAGGLATGVQSQTIVLPQIPDLLVIYAKPNTYQFNEADWYMPIERISVNFDNFSGLLSSHTKEELYQMAVNNGLDMDYNTWSGFAKQASASSQQVPLCGGFLVLKPSKDITLQSGQAPSLIGNYTLQFNVDVRNQSANNVSSWSLYTIAINSGYFESIKGSSRIVKGILTEQDIITAPLAPMGVRSSLHRMVGGGIFDNLASALGKAKDIASKVLPVAKAVAPMVKPMLPQGVQNVMGAVGLGRGKKGLSSRLME